jgi:uncharacterized membrane protein YozB (DUF420 family)
MVIYLPHVNVTLNAISIFLLLLGLAYIKRGKEDLHRWTMLATFATSVVFLISYLTYHYFAGSKRFPDDPAVAPVYIRYFYYLILLTHVLLAAIVPVLAIISIVYGLRNERVRHRRISKWTWPIWMYVSVTGVIVYLMLYQIYVPRAV